MQEYGSCYGIRPHADMTPLEHEERLRIAELTSKDTNWDIVLMALRDEGIVCREDGCHAKPAYADICEDLEKAVLCEEHKNLTCSGVAMLPSDPEGEEIDFG